ncbi:MAG: peptide deformylase [Thermomicrobiales bacterium]
MSDTNPTPEPQTLPATRVNGTPVDTYPTIAPEALRGHLLPIVVAGDPVLREPCAPVTSEQFSTPALEQLVCDLFLTMYAADGVGLAANQVGVGLQLFTYDVSDDGQREVGHICNPVIDIGTPDAEGHASQRVTDSEGCLSVPGIYKDVARFDHAIVRGVDWQGNPVVVEGFDYIARCLIHETDHLKGHLYVDYLTGRHRRDALRSMHGFIDEITAAREARAKEILGASG